MISLPRKIGAVKMAVEMITMSLEDGTVIWQDDAMSEYDSEVCMTVLICLVLRSLVRLQ